MATVNFRNVSTLGNVSGATTPRNLGNVDPVRTYGEVADGHAVVFADASGRRIKDGGVMLTSENFTGISSETPETIKDIKDRLVEVVQTLKGVAPLALLVVCGLCHAGTLEDLPLGLPVVTASGESTAGAMISAAAVTQIVQSATAGITNAPVIGNVPNVSTDNQTPTISPVVWPSGGFLSFDLPATGQTLFEILSGYNRAISLWKEFCDNGCGFYTSTQRIIASENTTVICPRIRYNPYFTLIPLSGTSLYIINAGVDTEISFNLSYVSNRLSATSTARWETWITVASPTNTIAIGSSAGETMLNVPDTTTTVTNETIRTRWSAWNVDGVTYIQGEPRTIMQSQLDEKVDAVAVTNAVHDVATSLVGHPYVLQGSTVVAATNVVLSVSGVAEAESGGVFEIMPYLANRPNQNGSTGTLHIATAPDTYIVDIEADIAVSTPNYGGTPQAWFPVEWRSVRVTDTNWIVYAWAPGQTSTYPSQDGYYATLSNLVVHTYNRPGYRPNTLTNDTAAIPSYTDTTDLTRADERRIPTAEGVRDYVTARKREIAQFAWRLTPAGKDAPSADFLTIDLPLVQQGSMAFLQSGDYYVMSYEGADWRSTTVGSMWTIGASGRSDLTITAEARMAFIRDFAVVGETATIYAATNWMGGAASTNGVPSGADPYVEFTETLSNPQWLACPDCTRAYFVDAVNGDYWRFIAPATAQTMFYRVQIPGGDRRIIAAPRLRLMNGLEVVNVATNQLDLITITNGAEVIRLMGVRL